MSQTFTWKGNTISLAPLTLIVANPDPMFEEDAHDLHRELGKWRRSLDPSERFQLGQAGAVVSRTPKKLIEIGQSLVKNMLAGERNILITLSDHVLRGVMLAAAQAAAGSSEEQATLEGVLFVEVAEGRLKPYKLNEYGEVEGLMVDSPLGELLGAGADCDSEIFYAGLKKKPQSEPGAEPLVIHDDGDEPAFFDGGGDLELGGCDDW